MKANLLPVTLCFLAVSSHLPASELDELRSQRAALEAKIKALEAKSIDGSKRSKQTIQSIDSKQTISSNVYIIRRGDNLEKIARRLQCSPKALASINGLKQNTIIHPGQKLKVPGNATATSTSSAAKETATPTKYRTHVIREGETYTSIAKIYGTTPRRLISANPKAKPTALRGGMKINVPVKSTASTPAMMAKTTPAKKAEPERKATPTAPKENQEITRSLATATSRPAATAPAPVSRPAEETATASSRSTKIRPVTVDGEVSFGEFASRHGTDISRLNSLNGLDLSGSTVLAKGSELYVPTSY